MSYKRDDQTSCDFVVPNGRAFVTISPSHHFVEINGMLLPSHKCKTGNCLTIIYNSLHLFSFGMRKILLTGHASRATFWSAKSGALPSSSDSAAARGLWWNRWAWEWKGVKRKGNQHFFRMDETCRPRKAIDFPALWKPRFWDLPKVDPQPAVGEFGDAGKYTLCMIWAKVLMQNSKQLNAQLSLSCLLYIYICTYMYIYIYIYIYMHQALPPPLPHGMGPTYCPHMRSSPSPLWCGGGVVWYVGFDGVYGRSGMACLESMVCMVGMYVWHEWLVLYGW